MKKSKKPDFLTILLLILLVILIVFILSLVLNPFKTGPLATFSIR